MTRSRLHGFKKTRARSRRHAFAAALACSLALGLGGPASGAAASHPDREVELFVQRRLVDARTFREQGRLDAAERALKRALAVYPDSVAAHRLLARVLEDQGRRGDAAEHWTRADALDPPPPPPPDTALPVDSAGVTVVLVDGGPDGGQAPDSQARRPDPELEAEILTQRLAARLPWAKVLRADPPSVAAARETLRQHGSRAALSLRTDRGFCGYSRKDGEFAVAWVRVASATPKELITPPATVREVIADPPQGDACVPWALSRALERALLETGSLDAVRRARDAGDDAWPSPTLRALFPGIGRRVALAIERGRARLATGRVASAAVAFREALALDPEDTDARAYLREAEDTLAIARALSPDDAPAPGSGEGILEYKLTPAERALSEALLDQERQRRDELIAALVIAEVEERAPPPEAIATLRPLAISNAAAPGVKLARQRTEGDVEARALYDEDGKVVTVYYFASGSEEPLLREEDTRDSGRADRWIGYEEGVRRDLWEDRFGRHAPDLHVRFAPDGIAIEQIDVDDDDDTRSERVFRYADGRLASESRDTDGDGALDRFETFDAEGRVTTREDDLDADGHPDIRTRYRDGRMLSREIENPELVESLLEP